MTSIDILIPTFNRSSLLGECIESVLRVEKPANLDWCITIIDNKSPDNTRQVVESFARKNPDHVHYLFEGRQGKSAALNAGIAATSRPLIGMIDDDEQLGAGWFDVTARWFADQEIGFIGGPYLPLWRVARPDWVPSGREGVLGADESASLPVSAMPFDGVNYFLRGGNAVVRRAVFERIGGFSENLGPVGEDHGACEDHDVYMRLLSARVKGMFVPELVIHHIVPPERVSRKYFRQWSLRRAESLAEMERHHRQNVQHIGRIPRYMIGSAVRALPAWLSSSDRSRRFGAELHWWDLAGYCYGAYLKPNAK